MRNELRKQSRVYLTVAGSRGPHNEGLKLTESLALQPNLIVLARVPRSSLIFAGFMYRCFLDRFNDSTGRKTYTSGGCGGIIKEPFQLAAAAS